MLIQKSPRARPPPVPADPCGSLRSPAPISNRGQSDLPGILAEPAGRSGRRDRRLRRQLHYYSLTVEDGPSGARQAILLTTGFKGRVAAGGLPVQNSEHTRVRHRGDATPALSCCRRGRARGSSTHDGLEAPSGTPSHSVLARWLFRRPSCTYDALSLDGRVPIGVDAD